MCGIAGIVELDERPATEATVRAMTERMVHRGPDDDGMFVSGRFGIGMRRLSIIDVPGGHQPIANEAGDVHLVFNGEIYNHRELRRELALRGHVFRTGSDAEVVLHLYEDHGVDALSRLNGMFAFAVCDTRRQTLWIARDRLGIKPLFFARTATRFAFASDVRALRSVIDSDLAPDQVLRYIALGYTPGETTLWRDIRRLPPAHWLRLHEGQLSIQSYWRAESSAATDETAEGAAARLEELLDDSTKLQLISDVPVGVFLSGGLDSSAIVAFASQHVTEPLRTFSVRFEGKRSADADCARAVADRFGTKHTAVTMGAGDGVAALDAILPVLDEPLADSALLPAYWLSTIARAEGVKVLLNGAGGDEIFGGYLRHWPAPFATPAWVAENLPRSAAHAISSLWSVLQPHHGLRASDPRFGWAAGVSGVNFAVTQGLLRDRGDFLTVARTIEEEFAPLVDPPRSGDVAYHRMLLDVATYLPQNVLALTDKATMAASVEGRLPLLDHRLVEFAFGLPQRINLLNAKPKGLLRHVMRRRLPPAVVDREKEGFNPPDAAWWGSGRGSVIVAELLDARVPVLDSLIDPVRLEQLLNNQPTAPGAAGTLYGLFMFNRWHRAQLAR